MLKRVLHVVDSDVFGGAEQAVLTLLAGTDQSRWEPVLAHHPFPGIAPLVKGAASMGVRTWSVAPMPPGPVGLRRLPGFVAALRRLSPDVVHLHLTWPMGCQYAQLAAVVARAPALVATVQLYVRLTLSTRVYAQQRLMARAVDRYLAVSSDIRTRLVNDLGWPPGRIEVIHNAVDVDGVRQEVDDKLRDELRGGGTMPLVLAAARLAPQKGQRDLLHAAVGVPHARFVLAGDGPDRAALEALARDLAVADRVVFLGERRDVPRLLAACDAAVLPSLFEGLPLALLEAMAAGKPVVASAIPGIDELVTSGHDGVLVPPRDPEALAAAIQRILDDAEEAGRLGRNARDTVKSRFSAATMCRRVGEVYDEILAR